MTNKTTTQLLKELENFKTFEEYETANKENLVSKTLSQHLSELLKEKNLVRAHVIRKAELGESYAYQIFSGLKPSPERDKIIALCIGMDLTVEETNSLLKIAGLLPLYPRNKRDSIIIINIQNKKSVVEINEILYDSKEKTLN